MYCIKKKKDYILIQAEPTQINYEAERFRGRCYKIDEWNNQITELVNNIDVKDKETEHDHDCSDCKDEGSDGEN